MAGGETLTIDVSGLVALGARLDGADQAVGQIEAALVNRLLSAGQAELMLATPVDTGQLRRSWAVLPARWDTSPIGGTVGTNKTYAREVNDGREPGEWPPEGSLLPWMRRHGIPAEREYFIRRKIFRKGTMAHRMVERAVAKMQGAVPAESDAAADAMVRYVLGSR